MARARSISAFRLLNAVVAEIAELPERLSGVRQFAGRPVVYYGWILRAPSVWCGIFD
jgi:hypothetical protein